MLPLAFPPTNQHRATTLYMHYSIRCIVDECMYKENTHIPTTSRHGSVCMCSLFAQRRRVCGIRQDAIRNSAMVPLTNCMCTAQNKRRPRVLCPVGGGGNTAQNTTTTTTTTSINVLLNRKQLYIPTTRQTLGSNWATTAAWRPDRGRPSASRRCRSRRATSTCGCCARRNANRATPAWWCRWRAHGATHRTTGEWRGFRCVETHSK